MSLDFSQPFTERTPRLVNAGKLKRAAGRRKAKAFLAEGENSVEAAVATGAATDLFVTEAAADRFADVVTAAGYMDVFTHAITDKAAQTLTDTVHTTGLFAVCKPVTWTLGSILKGRPKLVAVCVETNDPGNAGTIIRLVDALGADAVVFAGDTVDPGVPEGRALVRRLAVPRAGRPRARHQGGTRAAEGSRLIDVRHHHARRRQPRRFR